MARLQGRFLASGSVTTDKIVDDNVTFPKLDDAMIDAAEGLAVLDANRKLSIERIPQSLIDDVADHEARLNALEGRQTLRELVTLTQAEIDAKAFDLTNAPTTPALTILQPVNGVVAALGIDYSITGATIAWTGLGLDTVGLVAGDQIQVWYDYASGGVAGDLAQEILDRQAGDDALDVRLTTAEADIVALETDIIDGLAAANTARLNGDQLIYDDLQAFKNTKAVASGLASLDANGKVPATQLPNSVMAYKGVWDVSTNTPTLADGGAAEQIGDVYRVSVAGTRDLGSGAIAFDVGDYAIMNAQQIWEKSDTTDAVSSVNGKAGSVTVDLPDFPKVQTAFAAVRSIPLGAVLATMPHMTGAYNCTATTAADAKGFVVCGGQTIADASSPMNGQVVPNINNDVFLMGASTASGVAGGENSYTLSVAQLPSHGHSMAHTHAINHDHAAFDTASGGSHTHGHYTVTGVGVIITGPYIQGRDSTENRTARTGEITSTGSSHAHTINIPDFTGTSGPSSAANTGNQGSGSSIDNRPKYITAKYVMLIK